MSFDRLENFGDDSIWGFLTLCSLADEVVDDQVKVCLEVLFFFFVLLTFANF